MCTKDASPLFSCKCLKQFTKRVTFRHHQKHCTQARQQRRLPDIFNTSLATLAEHGLTADVMEHLKMMKEEILANVERKQAEQQHQESAFRQQQEQRVTYLSENGTFKTTVISRGYALEPIVDASAVTPLEAGCCPRGRLKCLVCKKCCRGCCKCTVGEVDTPAALAWTCL